MVRILLVSGSLRAGSTNSAVVRTLAEIAPSGVTTETFAGLGLLPHFNPDDDAEGAAPPAPVVELRNAIHVADALLFCTPEYAGALPGSFKNLLEWTVGDADERSISGEPVAWVNASGIHAPTQGADAHDSLRRVLGYVGAAIIEAACVRVPIARDQASAGIVRAPEARSELGLALATLAQAVPRPAG